MLGKMQWKTLKEPAAQEASDPVRAADLTYEGWRSEATLELRRCEFVPFGMLTMLTIIIFSALTRPVGVLDIGGPWHI
jgi:hypothetical protein